MLSSPVFGSNPLDKKTKVPPSTNSTGLIIITLDLAQDEDKDDYVAYEKKPVVFREEDIPPHFCAAAKSLIKKLIESDVYTLLEITADESSAVGIVKPFTLKFHQDHPTLLHIGDEQFLFNEVFTNINAAGEITYQVRTWDRDNAFHDIDANKLPYNELKLNHLNIVTPHLQTLEAETEKQEKERMGSLSKSF